MKQQHGGTLLGFIVGLLVGLGVALGVAVYVTKVPIPLVDRGVQRKPDLDAVEKERNKDWNPNASLASKSVPVPKPAEETPEAAPPSDKAAPGREVSGAVAGKPASKDPLGELLQARGDVKDTKTAKPAASPVAQPATEADPFVYLVQAGAYRAADEAEAQRAKLAMLGFNAKVTEREQAGRPVFRVRLGPYPQKDEADKVQERLVAQGVEAALVRTQR
jgi:cell division protein FtsN